MPLNVNPFNPDGTISQHGLADMARAVGLLSNPIPLGHLSISWSNSGILFENTAPELYWIKITSGTNPYAWTRQIDDGDGTFSDGQQTGTTTNIPAYEISGKADVAANTVVPAWPSLDRKSMLFDLVSFKDTPITFGDTVTFNGDVTINNNSNTVTINSPTVNISNNVTSYTLSATTVTISSTVTTYTINANPCYNPTSGPHQKFTAKDYPTSTTPGDFYVSPQGNYFVEPNGTLCRNVCTPSTGAQTSVAFWLELEETATAGNVAFKNSAGTIDFTSSSNGSAVVTGTSGNGRQFSSLDNGIGADDNITMGTGDAFVSCDVKVDTDGTGSGLLVTDGASGNNQPQLHVNGGNIIATFNGTTLTHPYTVGRWHHAIAWWDDTGTTLYLEVDGVQQSTSATENGARDGTVQMQAGGGSGGTLEFSIDNPMGGASIPTAAQRKSIKQGAGTSLFADPVSIKAGGTGANDAADAAKNIKVAGALPSIKSLMR